MLNRFRGQGALEYLLLIGGAVVVAAVVIVLLLGSGSTTGGQSGSTSMGVTCAELAIKANTTPNCGDLVKGSIDTGYVWNNKTNSCWVCSGSYPKCIARNITGDIADANKEVGCCSEPGDCGNPSSNKSYYSLT